MPDGLPIRRRDALILAGSLIPLAAEPAAFTNSIGMRCVPVPAGSFEMGESATLADELLDPLTYPSRSDLIKRYPNDDPRRFAIPFEHARHGDFDERPAHSVTISRAFFMGSTQVTNAQYEQFDPSHRGLRGKRGFSKEDDEAVVFVSWHEAKAFCEWLSKKEGQTYRLPAEAEWEYAARAGTRTPFWTGDRLPASMLKNARSTEFLSPDDIVPLHVAKTPANPWGLFDVHGNVEEWTLDWYGPYESGPATDPVGRVGGEFKVTRGGSHGTDPYYLRSANRAATLPGTRSWTIGFRVVVGEQPRSTPLPLPRPQRYQVGVSQRKPTRAVAAGAYFEGPRRFVKIPPGSHGPVFSHHNHDTAIAECPNGDLLAIWYTCEQERGRELGIAVSRLRHNAQEWEEASAFWDAPDHNDHCPALWFDGDQTLYHFNGLGVAGKWTPLAIVMRTSTDNGVTWSKARLIAPEFGHRNMVGQPVVRMHSGVLLFGADAGGGSTVWVSRDGGENWADAGGNINGVHAAIAETTDGGLVAMGRGQNIEGWMPRSVSYDVGKTWTASASTLPPIGGSQRATMIRLREGPLFLASFAVDVEHPAPAPPTDQRGIAQLFGALSFDDGKTWPVRRVITAGKADVDTIDGARVSMVEPLGYLASCQARDGRIHLISSWNHYAFNVEWLKRTHSTGSRTPQARDLPAKRDLPHRPTEKSGVSFDAARGFTVEVDIETGTVDVYSRGSALVANHYPLSVSPSGVFYGRGQDAVKIAETSGRTRYRLAVRDDTAVQMYRGNQLLSVQPAVVIVGWPQAARGSSIESAGVQAMFIDSSGAYRPE